MDNNNSNNPFYSKYEQSKPPSAKKAFGRPVEIPLPKKIKLSDIILIAAFAVIFLIRIFFKKVNQSRLAGILPACRRGWR